MNFKQVSLPLLWRTISPIGPMARLECRLHSIQMEPLNPLHRSSLYTLRVRIPYKLKYTFVFCMCSRFRTSRRGRRKHRPRPILFSILSRGVYLGSCRVPYLAKFQFSLSGGTLPSSRKKRCKTSLKVAFPSMSSSAHKSSTKSANTSGLYSAAFLISFCI